MIRTTLLTTAALIALAAPALAVEPATPAAEQNTETAFSQAVKSIKGWFGADTPDQPQPVNATTTAANDDTLQVPPPVAGNPAAIEPAAGNAMDDDIIQVPPPYYGEQSDAGARPRASSFDNNTATAAFSDGDANAAQVAQQASVPMQTPADIANIAPAAGEGTAPDASKMDCEGILKAAQQGEEGEVPDTALIEACEVPQEAVTPATDPAQPGFDGGPATSLPATQPAAGEPPVGGAVMPGQPETAPKAE